MEDREYLKKLANGDADAYETLFMRYHPKLVYFLVGFLHDEEMARDIAQDIFLTIWNNRKKMSEIHSFSNYIFAMARHAVSNHFNNLIVQEKYHLHESLQPYQTDSVEEDIFARELQALIMLAIEQMPEQRKKVFKMSRFENIPNNEIAEKLNISKRTVENHITSALADLRKVIKLAMVFL